MNNNLMIAVALSLALASCQQPVDPVSPPKTVLIEPVITRASEVNFEDGDKIGLSVIKSDGSSYADNAVLSYADGLFSGNLEWYPDGGELCSLKAFYPYSATGFPSSFTVCEDQTSGAGAYDLMLATKEGVKPQESAVAMIFRHQLSQVVLNVSNPAGVKIESFTLKGLLPTVILSEKSDGQVEAVVDESASKIDIIAEPVVPDTKYRAIVVPQTMSFGVSLKTVGGNSVFQQFSEVTMLPGYTYSINAEVTARGVKFSLNGEIQAWEDGGILDPGHNNPSEPDFEENLDAGWFVYDGVKYPVVKMKDAKVAGGKWWMAANLRYIPYGMTPCSDLNNVTGGVYYPVVLDPAKGAAVFSTDESVIVSNGYLYQTETALGLKVGDLTSVAQAEALDGARGICPKGWHIPTDDDIMGLVGKAVTPWTLDKTAPYYDANLDGGSGSIALLNEDGFNADAWGAVSIVDNTKTVATLMGALAAYPGAIASGMMCGSTYASVTYNSKDDPSSGIKNLQFLGFMPMMNKGTFNGTRVSYRIAAPVRCVRDEE